MTDEHTYTPPTDDAEDEEDSGEIGAEYHWEAKDIELTVHGDDDDSDDADEADDAESFDYLDPSDVEFTSLEYNVHTDHQLHHGIEGSAFTRGREEYEISFTVTADVAGTDFLEALMDAAGFEWP